MLHYGGPEEIRTPGLWFRKPTLYPTELRVRLYTVHSFLAFVKYFINKYFVLTHKHKHLLISSTITKSDCTESFITSWISNLVDAIGMKILHGPISLNTEKIGNKGITAFCIIETSHIALHLWTEETPNKLQLDVYSCQDFKVDIVLELFNQFNPIDVKYKFLDRETDLVSV